MITLTDNEGRMLPAFRNLITLIFCIVFFFFGWFGHINWALRGQSDQLISDSKAMVDVRKEKRDNKVVLTGNIKNANKIKQDDCNCGDATDIDFQRELRHNREKGFKFN